MALTTFQRQEPYGIGKSQIPKPFAAVGGRWQSGQDPLSSAAFATIPCVRWLLQQLHRHP